MINSLINYFKKMDEKNIKYITREELRNIEPSLISSMTLSSGTVIIVNPEAEMETNEFGEEKLCDQCSLYTKYYNQPNENVVLRAKKEIKSKGENIEGNLEIDVTAQQEGQSAPKKEVLRGADGKPLLMDILTGNTVNQDNQLDPQPKIEENINQENNYQQQEQNDGKYYEQPESIQQVPEQNEQFNEQGFENQYYNTQDQYNQSSDEYQQDHPQSEAYPPQEMDNQNVPEQYAEPNADNQGYTLDNNLYPPEEEYQGEQEQEKNQIVNYPTFDDNNQESQQQEYQEPFNVPQGGQGYYQETQPEFAETLPNYPTTQQEQMPIQAPQHSPNQPPNQPTIQPNNQKIPFQPQNPSPMPGKEIQKKKPFIPQNQQKKKGIQIQFGFGLPKISFGIGQKRIPMAPPQHGAHRPYHPIGHHPRTGFYPHKQQFGPGGKRVIIDPIGGIINAVNQVMAPITGIAAKRLGLRSTKPPTSGKNIEKKSVKTGAQQEPVLRARRKNVNRYFPKKEILCPECASKEYGNKFSNASQNYLNQNKEDINNFNFHEIVETSDNSKSYVVAKKGGIIVSSDQ